MVQDILWIGYNLNLCDFKSPKLNILLLYASFSVFCAHCYFLHFCVWKCWAWILVFITSRFQDIFMLCFVCVMTTIIVNVTIVPYLMIG